jgi:hypothetical protein
MAVVNDQPTRYGLSEDQFETLQQLCEYVVPGSTPAGPAVYLDSLVADWPAGQRESLHAILDEVRTNLASAAGWADVTGKPYFPWLRALAIEAYYSDFRQPGYDGPGAWAATGFISTPMAARAVQDWSFLRCYQQEAASHG